MSKSQWDPTLPDKARDASLAASDAQKEEALKHATQFLDTLPWKGERATSHQSLSWPRKGIFRDDGSPIEGVPPEVQEACFLVAGFILAKIPYDVPAVAYVFSVVGHLLDDPDPSQAPARVTWH